jgi:hypothetical protein
MMKYENLTLEAKNIWKLNKVSTYRIAISGNGVFTRNFLKYLENVGLTKNILRVGQNEFYYEKISRFQGHGLDLPLTKPNPTKNLG